MTLLFACDLAARKSGWVLLDIDQQPYKVVSHGIVEIRGEWGPLAWEEMQRAWRDVLESAANWAVGGAMLDAIAYEIPGQSDQRDMHRTRRMMAQAEALFGAVAVGYTLRIMALDQSEVKLAITGQRGANKQLVSTVLEMRRLSGEFAFDGELNSDHEIDALAIALYAAVQLRQEAMA